LNQRPVRSTERHDGAEEGTTARPNGTPGWKKARLLDRTARPGGGRLDCSTERHDVPEEGTTVDLEGTTTRTDAAIACLEEAPTDAVAQPEMAHAPLRAKIAASS
jgi:hypothetical protein